MAPAVDPNIDARTNYTVARIRPNGQETILGTRTVTDDLTVEQVQREATFQLADQQRINNPSWRVVIYGPVDPPSTWYTNDDRIWDSAINL